MLQPRRNRRVTFRWEEVMQAVPRMTTDIDAKIDIEVTCHQNLTTSSVDRSIDM